MSCDFCSCATVSRSVGWTTQFPVCSCYVPCLSGLKAVLNSEQGYKLFSLPGCSERSSCKASNAFFVVLTQACLHSMLHGQIGPLALFCRLLCLLTHLLAWALMGYAASKNSHHPFWLDGARNHALLQGRLWLSSPAWAGQGGPTSDNSPQFSWTGFPVGWGWELHLATGVAMN